MQIRRSSRFPPLVSLVLLSGTVASAAIKTFNNPDHSLCCGPRGTLVSIDGLPVRDKPGFASHALPLQAIDTSVPAAAPNEASTTLAAKTVSTSVPGAGASDTGSAAAPRPPEVVNGYLKLGFERLASFPFNPAPYDPAKPNEPPPSSADQIPQQVRNYDGKKAVVTGFMLPVKTEKGLVTEFLLMRDAMMCCYGVVPNINEWVVVRMTNGGVQAAQDVPLNVFGKLQVKELYENGYLSGIYLLEGEKMALATN